METISLESSEINAAPKESGIPIYLYATVLSSLSIMIGLIWDISWHTSIGRDGLFSAPHLAIYLGGVTAGIFSGIRVLKISFAGTPTERAGTVHFWGIFYGSLGNLFCIWGAIAMLTSAPFDDWWHNTYGLDVTILSPPHTVLLLGMITIQFGAIVSVLAHQNVSRVMHQNLNGNDRGFNVLFSLSAGFVLCMIFTMASEYFDRSDMHRVFFYQVSAGLFPIFLLAFSGASKTNWGATYAALVYSLFLMVMNWVLPLFPATPKLGPVLNPITSFQPFHFPLLIFFPSILIDLISHRLHNKNRWLVAIACGVVFVAVLFIIQWPFANVLMNSKGHWFFGTSRWYFGMDPNVEWRYQFMPWMEHGGMKLTLGLLIAAGIAMLSSRVGLSWGNWMKKILR